VKKIIEARVEHEFKASAARVFDAWLDPALVRQWLSASLKSHGLSGEIRRMEIDARVGGRFTFSDSRAQGEAVHWGTYLEIDRPRKLVFSWFTSKEDEAEGSSLVTLLIEPRGSGCKATIVHRMSSKYAEYVQRTEQGWGRMLEHIDAISQPPGARGPVIGPGVA
jgi:uncharacterized protein YndB with AHSA1/START domain